MRSIRAKARPVEQVHEVGVLGEAEDARQDGVDPEEAAGDEVVAARGEREAQGQPQVVVAERVGQVQPGLGAVGPQELAAQDAGHEHGRRDLAARVERPDEPGVEAAAGASAWARRTPRPPPWRRR